MYIVTIDTHPYASILNMSKFEYDTFSKIRSYLTQKIYRSKNKIYEDGASVSMYVLDVQEKATKLLYRIIARIFESIKLDDYLKTILLRAKEELLIWIDSVMTIHKVLEYALVFEEVT